MWRTLICGAAICAAGAAAAQESLDDMLASVSVVDCTAAGDRAVYVFQSDEDGAVTLLSEGAQAGLSAAGLPEDLREIAKQRYLVFEGGADTPGTCLTVTEIARGIYPAVTAGFLPKAGLDTVGEARADDLAAAVTIRDLRARLAQAEAENRDLQVRLGTAEADNRDLQGALSEAKAATRDAVARIADLQSMLAVSEAVAVAAERRVGDLEAEIAGLQGALEAEKAARLAEAAMMREVQAQLAETAAALQRAEAERRGLVASAAMLGERKVLLEGELEGARDAAEDARTETAAMQNLADSAVLRIATMQQRDPDSVRAEVCLFLQGDRPELCQ